MELEERLLELKRTIDESKEQRTKLEGSLEQCMFLLFLMQCLVPCKDLNQKLLCSRCC